MVTIPTPRRVQEGCVTHGPEDVATTGSAVSFWAVVIKCRDRKEGAGAGGRGGAAVAVYWGQSVRWAGWMDFWRQMVTLVLQRECD